MADETPFVSVKLSALLVRQARDAAPVMRRSVAGQIEYWATLGRALESSGLTITDSHALIARQERPPWPPLPALANAPAPAPTPAPATPAVSTGERARAKAVKARKPG